MPPSGRSSHPRDARPHGPTSFVIWGPERDVLDAVGSSIARRLAERVVRLRADGGARPAAPASIDELLRRLFGPGAERPKAPVPVPAADASRPRRGVVLAPPDFPFLFGFPMARGAVGHGGGDEPMEELARPAPPRVVVVEGGETFLESSADRPGTTRRVLGWLNDRGITPIVLALGEPPANRFEYGHAIEADWRAGAREAYRGAVCQGGDCRRCRVGGVLPATVVVCRRSA